MIMGLGIILASYSTADLASILNLFPGDVPRVNGQLAVSRAFGDKSLKSHLRSDPDIQETDIDSNTEVLVLASDGLWKVSHFILTSFSMLCQC
jgi:serine/threonine protein phosphatase PrpC